MYYVIVEMPYEGSYVQMFKLKRLALLEYNKALVRLDSDDYQGVALLKGETLKTKGTLSVLEQNND